MYYLLPWSWLWIWVTFWDHYHHSLDLTNKLRSFIFIWTIRKKLLSCCTFVIAIGFNQLFSNPLYNPQMNTEMFVLTREWLTVKHTVSNFIEEWIVSWCCFSPRQCQTDSSLRHRRQNLKQTKSMGEINNLKWQKFTHRILYILWWLNFSGQ